MDNPWKDLHPDTDSWILPMDREAVDKYNSSKHDERIKIVTGSIPAPFIGNPESAKLVMLNLNPGHSECDARDQSDPDFRGAMLLSLKHELREYPFYPLNPSFAHTGAGKWWNKKLGPLRKELGLNDSLLSQMLMVIEWFPYHSEKSGLPKNKKLICESQDYSFFLAKYMLNKDRVIVLGMRSSAFWLSSDQAFHNVPFLNSPQNPSISRKNMNKNKDLYENILKLLRE